MYASNIRMGFATNSSSSHSVVLGIGERQVDPITHPPDDFEFGWDNFQLATASDKAGYLACGIDYSLEGLPRYQKNAVMAGLFEGTCVAEAFNEQGDYSAYIDHQSAFKLPNAQSPHFPAAFREAMDFFCDRRVTVHGGNDNCEDVQPGMRINGNDYDPLRFRRDGDNYVVFNWRNGTKIRLTPGNAPYEKSARPELVDLKITDQCPFGCSFCYQGSTKGGNEGDLATLGDIIAALGINHLGCFEVAIGGGEPTHYPHFADIIRMCVDHYLKPNFTTFAVDWLLDEDKVNAARLCGGIGVSVHRSRDLDKVKRIKDTVRTTGVMAQHVYGTLPVDETADLIKACAKAKIPLLLLGYKTVGFGANQTPHNMAPLASDRHLPEYHLRDISLSVDTAMVDQHPELLAHIEANTRFYTKREGAFSMYVDGVTGKVGPSSYCGPDEMEALPMEKGDRYPYSCDPGRIAMSIEKRFQAY